MLEWVKSHPYATGGVVIGVVVLAYVMSGDGGSPTSVGGASSDEIAAGVALQNIQAQAAGQSNAIAGQIQLAEIQSASDIELANLYATLSMADINRQQQTDALAINAQSLLAQLSAETTQTGMQFEYESDKLMADYMTHQLDTSYLTTEALIKGQVKIAEINKPKRGLFSMIFG